MLDAKPIKQCVCFDTPFEELKASGLRSLSEIASTFGCSTKCGFCGPYINLMLETGEVAFAVSDTEQD